MFAPTLAVSDSVDPINSEPGRPGSFIGTLLDSVEAGISWLLANSMTIIVVFGLGLVVVIGLYLRFTAGGAFSEEENRYKEWS